MYIILIRILKILFKFNLGVRDGVSYVGRGVRVRMVWWCLFGLFELEVNADELSV